MNHTPERVKLEAVIPDDLAGLRLDQAIAKLFPEYSRSRLQHWIKSKQLTVDGKYRRPRDKIVGGEAVVVEALIEPEESWKPQAIDLDLLYEDDAILLINKPVGLVVHPAAGNREGTLLNALIHHEPSLATIPRAGIVHRLDKDTSGIMVVAKTLTAHTRLVSQLQKRAMSREYVAIVNGLMLAGSTVDAPIGRHPVHRTKMAVVASGKPAITHYRVAERYRAHTLLDVKLETGRTHQIRVHMAYIRHPIIGDKTYGGRLQIPKATPPELAEGLRKFHRQALHAQRLTLKHPVTANEMTWTAPIPEDMCELIALLKAGMMR